MFGGQTAHNWPPPKDHPTGHIWRNMANGIGSHMAEYGEWNRKGAALSDVTAQKEYGVTRDFIVKGIQAGKLEFREGAVELCVNLGDDG